MFHFLSKKKRISLNKSSNGDGSLISRKGVGELKFFVKNGKSEGTYVKVGELNLVHCEITDEMLNEIIIE